MIKHRRNRRPTLMLLSFLTLSAVSEGGSCDTPKTNVTPQLYGAKGDGSNDDTASLQQWIDAIAKGAVGELPSGNYRFSRPLIAAFSNGVITGDGPYRSILTYAGADTDRDLFTIGDGVHQVRNWFLSGLRISSEKRMTGGAALRLRLMARSTIRDLVADGQDGNGNLWNGLWFDGIDLITLNGFESRAQNDALRVNGTLGAGPKADLLIAQGKIGGSGVGLHVGGGFGGLTVDGTDIISNKINVLIDNALVHEGNREIFFGLTSMNDSASGGDDVDVNDTLAGSATLVLGGWIASAAENCIHIRSWPGSVVSISAPEIFNCAKDGVFVEDPTARIDIGAASQIRANKGWGIHSSVPTSNVHSASLPFGNAAGAISDSVRISLPASR